MRTSFVAVCCGSSSNWELRLESSEIVGLCTGFSPVLGEELLTTTLVGLVSGTRMGLVDVEGVRFAG
jgi:hypothetical protein